MNYSHIEKINNLFKKYDKKIVSIPSIPCNIQICEKCFEGRNILICEVCKLFFHYKCEYPNMKNNSIPITFLCSNCKSFKVIIKKEVHNFSIYSILKERNTISNQKESKENHKIINSNNESGVSNISNINKEIKLIVNSSQSNNYNIHLSKQDSNFKKGDKEKKQITQFHSNQQSQNNENQKKRKKRQNLEDTLFTELLENNRSGSFNLLREKRTLHTFDHTDINFKKRKIRVGEDYNIDFSNINNESNANNHSNQSFTNNQLLSNSGTYSNNANGYFHKNNENEVKIVDAFENSKPNKIFNGINCPLTPSQIDNYLKNAFFFWNYRNIDVENELCSEYYKYYDEYISKADDDDEFLDQLEFKHLCVKNLVEYGICLNNHFEEMALKILHLTNYSIKKALFFLFRSINPYLEEEIEGFKSDVSFMQREAFSLIKEYEQNKI